MQNNLIKQSHPLLLIGGATRNVGKTSFICGILKNLSNQHQIVTLKVKAIYPNDRFFHGKDNNPLQVNEHFRITKELSADGVEDTSRLLRCGAVASYKIKAEADFLAEAFRDFLTQIAPNTPIICESNSLNYVVKPDLYVLIKSTISDDIKPSAKHFEHRADKIMFTNGVAHDFSANQIKLSENKWSL